MLKKIKDWLDKINNYFKARKDHKIALREAFSKGYMTSVNENIDKMKRMEIKVEETIILSTENERMQSKNYQDNIEHMHEEHRKNLIITEDTRRRECTICKSGMESERQRLLSIRKEFLDAMEEFLAIHNKLATYVALMGNTHENVLIDMSRIQASNKHLQDIKEQADLFMRKNKNLLEYDV